MNLATMIEQKATALKDASDKRVTQTEIDFNQRANGLALIIEKIKPSLNAYGLDVKLHTNKSYQPCPAIHIGKDSSKSCWSIRDKISEICGDIERGFSAGSCNNLPYKFFTETELIHHIAGAVSVEVASGKLQWQPPCIFEVKVRD